MAAVEKPIFVVPKKRMSGKKTNLVNGYVDHIISIQGFKSEKSNKKESNATSSKKKDSTLSLEALKSNMRITLPAIIDSDEEVSTAELKDVTEQNAKNKKEPSKPHQYVNVQSNGDLDLSPIYENSSEACSSHDDLQENHSYDTLRSVTTQNYETISSPATPLSINSRTYSEASVEINYYSESARNSIKKSKKSNTHVPESVYDYDQVIESEISVLNLDTDDFSEYSVPYGSKEDYLTMTGTIKRGKDNLQNVDVKLKISREELEFLEAAVVAKESANLLKLIKCSKNDGIHIFIWSLCCVPFVIFISCLYTFYIGLCTFLNIVSYVYKEKRWVWKIILSPLLLFLTPLFVVILTSFLGIYSGFAQISLNRFSWWRKVRNLEKGFYGWLCEYLKVTNCCPYDVVILSDVKINTGYIKN